MPPSSRHQAIDPVPPAPPTPAAPVLLRVKPGGGGGASAGGGRVRTGAGNRPARPGEGGPAEGGHGGDPPVRAEPAAAAVGRSGPVDDLDRLRQAVRAVVPGASRDLTLRQLAVLLLINDTQDQPRTACVLAAELAIPRPAMTRALDRLGALGLARRDPDPSCRRSVLVRVTPRGRLFLAGIRRRMVLGAA